MFSLFGRQPSNLAKRSGKIVNVFTKTSDSLRKVNQEADLSADEKDKKRLKLEQELKDLEIIKKENEKVISKIEKIFE